MELSCFFRTQVMVRVQIKQKICTGVRYKTSRNLSGIFWFVFQTIDLSTAAHCNALQHTPTSEILKIRSPLHFEYNIE